MLPTQEQIENAEIYIERTLAFLRKGAVGSRSHDIGNMGTVALNHIYTVKKDIARGTIQTPDDIVLYLATKAQNMRGEILKDETKALQAVPKEKRAAIKKRHEMRRVDGRLAIKLVAEAFGQENPLIRQKFMAAETAIILRDRIGDRLEQSALKFDGDLFLVEQKTATPTYLADFSNALNSLTSALIKERILPATSVENASIDWQEQPDLPAWLAQQWSDVPERTVTEYAAIKEIAQELGIWHQTSELISRRGAKVTGAGVA